MINKPRILETVDTANNPEPRCACVLLMDTSGSMKGRPIDALNQGLIVLRETISQDSLASQRVELALVTFSTDVKVVQDFTTVDGFAPPTLRAGGYTFMGTGIIKALDMIHARKEYYKANALDYYRPWVFMITDGEPQGEASHLIGEAGRRIIDDENNNRVAFFAVGVEEANMEALATITHRDRPPKKLKGLDFSEMFLWLGNSMQRVSGSRPGTMVPLEPAGWAEV